MGTLHGHETVLVRTGMGAEHARRAAERVLDAFPAGFFPSVIHDLQNGRRTEMEELGGEIVRLAGESGVEAPLHEAATCAVQLAEDLDPAK